LSPALPDLLLDTLEEEEALSRTQSLRHSDRRRSFQQAVSDIEVDFNPSLRPMGEMDEEDFDDVDCHAKDKGRATSPLLKAEALPRSLPIEVIASADEVPVYVTQLKAASVALDLAPVAQDCREKGRAEVDAGVTMNPATPRDRPPCPRYEISLRKTSRKARGSDERVQLKKMTSSPSFAGQPVLGICSLQTHRKVNTVLGFYPGTAAVAQRQLEVQDDEGGRATCERCSWPQ
jgi:hypothetical protein